MTESSLEQQALSQLNAEHYKEAIELYKQLWETSDDKKWQQQLAHCYIQRSLSFAERDMLREALLQWEKYIQYAEMPYEFYDCYIDWLIQAGDLSKVKSALQQLSAQQLDKQYSEFTISLGLLMLTKHPEFQQYLPKESTFISHFKVAKTAWQDYQNNDLDSSNQHLKQLPYRSAFKDFRLVLNAAQNFPHSVEQALTKIAVTSPYALIINLLHACTLNGFILLEKLSQFNYSQREMIAEIKGFDSNQRQFIETVIQHHGGLTDKIQFNLGIQYQLLIGPELAQHFCQGLLANYPAGQNKFIKHFAATKSFEDNRIKALVNEHIGDSENAAYFWRQCIDTLSANSVENSLKKALILRHMAAFQSDSYECNQLLIESLDHDSDDLASYQQILQYVSQDSDNYEKWLKKTIEKFPYNIDILTQAIQIMTSNKAYEAASQYALKILSIDPLNTVAKDILFSNYLTEARQFIHDKEYPLAAQKIRSAEDLNLDKQKNAQAQLIRGLYCLASQDKKQGLELINKSLNVLNKAPVTTHFKATMEALLTGLPVADVLRGLDPIEEYLLSEQELTRVIQQLKYYGEEFDHPLLLLKAIEKITPALTKSLTKHNYDETQLLILCETLSNINAFELLQHCAKLAVDKWSSPIWRYYQLFSKYNGIAEKCSSKDIIQLKQAREQTVDKKDNRTRILIDTFLDDYYHSSETGIGIIENLLDLNKDNSQEIFVDPLEQLFAQIPEDELLNLTNKTEALTMSTTPEQLVECLIKETNNQEFVLQAMMQQPNLFSALIVIKAADSLGISMNTHVNDILLSFNVNLKK